MDEATRTKVLDVLAVALSDGTLSEPEKQFINDLRLRLGVSDEEFRELLAQVRARPGELAVPDQAHATEVLELLVEAAAVDADIAPGEVAVIRQIGQSAGVDSAAVEAMLDSARHKQSQSEDRIEAFLEEVYLNFANWDADTRHQKIDQIGDFGGVAIVPLLRLFESYRVPDNMPDNLELKELVVDKFGQLGDQRAVYYLAQQVSIGDVDDEVTNGPLRFAAAHALGLLIGKEFPADQHGVEAARRWWFAEGNRKFDKLAF